MRCVAVATGSCCDDDEPPFSALVIQQARNSVCRHAVRLSDNTPRDSQILFEGTHNLGWYRTQCWAGHSWRGCRCAEATRRNGTPHCRPHRSVSAEANFQAFWDEKLCLRVCVVPTLPRKAVPPSAMDRGPGRLNRHLNTAM